MTPSLNELLDTLELDKLIGLEAIPALDLYMDQLITFFDMHLGHTKRSETDKLLTKTMINNYTKNKLLMPAQKKKYTKDHMVLMLLIYQLKQVTSMEDIKTLLAPLFTGGSVDSHALQSLYQSYLESQEGEADLFKAHAVELDTLAREKTADSQSEPAASLLLCLLLFKQSLDCKRLAEKLLDTLTEPPKPGSH